MKKYTLDRCKELRNIASLSKSDLSSAANIDKGTLAKLEDPERSQITEDPVSRVFYALKKHHTDLVFDDEVKQVK